ncbi:MAG: UDP-N-acetylmuramate--L-alanine ligase [Ignavibacteria bacterium]|jgi:UDP-N-acetylmuramate--alanine ligase
MDLSKVKKIYMVGIKGVGMTMLAEFLVAHGYQVSGSDISEVFMTDAVLAKSHINVYTDLSVDHLHDVPDLVVYSLAYSVDNHPELQEAKKRNLKIASYSETLGAVFNTYHGVAVCGSHGKTTTSAWLGFVLWKALLHPNVMVGAAVPQFTGASLTGNSNYLIVEADEYKNKLQYLNPKMILLNNIDFDHPDYFLTIESYHKVFSDFIARLPKSGKLIANFDDDQIRNMSEKGTSGEVISYSLHSPADYVAENIRYQAGRQYFKVCLYSKDKHALEENETNDLGDFSILLSGQHNISNALAVIIAALELGAELHLVRRYLGEFTGTARRMQVLGEYNQAIIIDDYAHHPTEIVATLDAITQKYSGKKIRVVFHPHTFSRTKALLSSFGKSFTKADEVIVLDIYGSAREEQGGVSGAEVAQEIKYNGHEHVQFIPTLQEVEVYLRSSAHKDEVIVLMGAGDVFKIGEQLLYGHN